MLRIRFERTHRELNQKTVALLARIHQPDLSRIENGRLVPTPQQLQRLADVFGVQPPHKLLEHVAVVVAG